MCERRKGRTEKGDRRIMVRKAKDSERKNKEIEGREKREKSRGQKGGRNETQRKSERSHER